MAAAMPNILQRRLHQCRICLYRADKVQLQFTVQWQSQPSAQGLAEIGIVLVQTLWVRTTRRDSMFALQCRHICVFNKQATADISVTLLGTHVNLPEHFAAPKHFAQHAMRRCTVQQSGAATSLTSKLVAFMLDLSQCLSSSSSMSG